MLKNHIIEKIEFLWQGYWQKQSDRLFNHATDMFMENIISIPYCKIVLDRLKEDYPFVLKQITYYENIEYFELLKDNNSIQILSFLYHWYEERKKSANMNFYYKVCRWIGYSKEATEIDKMQMFKTDIIRPIIDYIIYNLNDKGYVLYLLDKYKKRIKYFEKIKCNIRFIGNGIEKAVSHKTDGMMILNESKLQEDLCLFLFDNGVDVHKEEVVGNGRLDIMINHNNEPFIIEVKYIKEKEEESIYKKRINKSVTQIKDYMFSKGAKCGCIFIYTEVDVEFIAVNKSLIDIQIHSIYIGNKSPSQRISNYIEIDIK